MGRRLQICIFLLFLSLLITTEVSAESKNSADKTKTETKASTRNSSSKTTKKSSKKKSSSKNTSKKVTKQYKLDHGKWKTGKKHIYYYDSTKKKVTGLVKIGKRKYYFDKKGIQWTGWRKYKGNYYYFRTYNGKKGYMVTGKKVNGIKLTKSGKAKLGSDILTKKVKIMAECSKLVNKNTYATMKKKKKLKTMFEYVKKNYSYTGGSFSKAEHWEIDYAWQMVRYGNGTCYHFGVMFAFFANAVGYNTAYAVSSGGHGWAEVEGCVCDPTQQMADKKHSYFLMPMELSGVNGRPRYSRNRVYIKKI